MQKIACYVRVSTDEQNVEMQKDAIEKYLSFKGQQNAALFYIDKGESGAKTSRPAFDKMMRDIRAGKISTVITWKFDRIGRSTSHLISVMDELKNLNVEFISLTENIDTTSIFGKMIFTIFAAIADFERDTLILRTKAGIKAAKSRGVQFGRKKQITDAQIKDVLYLWTQKMSVEAIMSVHPRLSRASIYRIVKGTL